MQMHRVVIAVADAARARIFLYECQTTQGGHEALVELRDLANPGRRMRAGEMFSESRPTIRNQEGGHGTSDDHRDQHILRYDEAFAQTIVQSVTEVIQSSQASRIVLCAGPGMMGILRDEAKGKLVGTSPASQQLPVEEITKDLVKLSPGELLAYLQQHGALPSANQATQQRRASS